MAGGAEQVILMSIKPEFAHIILDGTKTVELRRVAPKAVPGTIVALYASSPERAIIGMFVLGGVETSSVSALWESVGRKSGLSRRAFRQYFMGASKAHALTVQEPSRFKRPISLRHIRFGFPGFRPPQSFRYLRGDFSRLRSAIEGV